MNNQLNNRPEEYTDEYLFRSVINDYSKTESLDQYIDDETYMNIIEKSLFNNRGLSSLFILAPIKENLTKLIIKILQKPEIRTHVYHYKRQVDYENIYPLMTDQKEPAFSYSSPKYSPLNKVEVISNLIANPSTGNYLLHYFEAIIDQVSRQDHYVHTKEYLIENIKKHKNYSQAKFILKNIEEATHE